MNIIVGLPSRATFATKRFSTIIIGLLIILHHFTFQDESSSYILRGNEQVLWIDMAWYMRLVYVMKQLPCYLLLFLFPFFSSCCPWSRDVSIDHIYIMHTVAAIWWEIVYKDLLFIFSIFAEFWWSRSWSQPNSLVCEPVENTTEPLHLHCFLLHDISFLHHSVCGRSSTSNPSCHRYPHSNMDHVVHV